MQKKTLQNEAAHSFFEKKERKKFCVTQTPEQHTVKCGKKVSLYGAEWHRIKIGLESFTQWVSIGVWTSRIL